MTKVDHEEFDPSMHEGNNYLKLKILEVIYEKNQKKPIIGGKIFNSVFRRKVVQPLETLSLLIWPLSIKKGQNLLDIFANAKNLMI